MSLYQPSESFLRSQRFRTDDEAIDHRFRFYKRSMPNTDGHWVGIHAKPGVRTMAEFDSRNMPVGTYEIASDRDILFALAGRRELTPLALQ